MATQNFSPLTSQFLGTRPSVAAQLMMTALGVVFLTALAQIKLPLPWTPVPVTGQTFGVIWLSLLTGRKQAVAIVASYLILGFLGLPLFAAVKFGATSGYLAGMLIAAFLIGTLAEKGWAQSFSKALLAGTLGTVIIFACGLIGLSFFLPTNQLLVAGLTPFLPGAVIKIVAAAGVTYGMSKTLKS